MQYLREHKHGPRNYAAAAVIVLLWAAVLWWLWARFGATVTSMAARGARVTRLQRTRPDVRSLSPSRR